MSVTSGSYSAPQPAVAPDNAKEIKGYTIGIPAGAGVAQTINPVTAFQGFTVYNYTNNLLRGVVTFVAGITSVADRTFLVPPGATYSVDFSDNTVDAVAGALDAIDTFSLIAVNPGTTTSDAVNLTVATAATAGMAYVNFASA